MLNEPLRLLRVRTAVELEAAWSLASAEFYRVVVVMRAFLRYRGSGRTLPAETVITRSQGHFHHHCK